MRFKNDLPLNCPDKNILEVEENKSFFRVVKHSPPDNSDFIPVWFLRQMDSSCECFSKGISISERVEDAEMLIKTFRNLGKHIYSGTIFYKECGIVKITPNNKNPSHRTWYPLIDTNEKEIFNICER